jgi:hypothetical protein
MGPGSRFRLRASASADLNPAKLAKQAKKGRLAGTTVVYAAAFFESPKASASRLYDFFRAS